MQLKANPNKKIIKLLNSLGSSFDCASIGEIETCISTKVSPERKFLMAVLLKRV